MRRTTRALRAAIRTGGAAESGLADLVELCALNAAADTLVAVALANTVFFNVPLGEARDRVALYLLITMAPFALLAPVIGPVLDRLHSRRYGLAATFVFRVVLAWILATRTTGLAVYPVALGTLVMSRGFGIARAAVVPRALPEGTSLFTANSRVSLVGAIGAGIAAPIGVGIDASSASRPASVRLPAVRRGHRAVHQASQAGRLRRRGEAREPAAPGDPRRRPQPGQWSRRHAGGPARRPPAARPVGVPGHLPGVPAEQRRRSRVRTRARPGLALLGAAVLIGQSVGIILGNRLGRRRPEALVIAGLVIALVSLTFGALSFSRSMALWVALLGTLAAALAKLGLDAVIQRDVAERIRNSAFARSETALQLAWVAGGALGLLPLEGWQGFALAAVGVLIGSVIALPGLRSSARARRANADTQAGDRSAGHPAAHRSPLTLTVLALSDRRRVERP